MGKSNELNSEDGFRNLARARPRLRSRPLWQVRRDELDRRIFKGVARIRRLQSPTQWEVGVRSTLLRAEHASMWGEYRISDRAGRPSRPDHWAASFRVAARQAVAAVCGWILRMRK